MTVENSATIDAVGTDAQTGAVHLSIFAHLPWDARHLLLLQEKINSYLGFIESGQIYDAYPQAKGQPLVIDVFTKFRPTQDAAQFLCKAQFVAEQYGASLCQQHAGTGYADDSA